MENSYLDAELNLLTENLTRLKSLFEYPRVYLINHFNELKRRVENSFLLREQSLDKRVHRKQLERDCAQILALVASFQQDCLHKQKLNTFNYEITQRTHERIKLIEKKFDELEHTKMLDYDFNEVNQDIQYLSGLIYDEKTKIEKIIFLNKTLIYLNKLEMLFDDDDGLFYFNSDSETEDEQLYDCIFDNTKCSKDDEFDLIVGKIIFIENDFIGDQGIEYLKKYKT